MLFDDFKQEKRIETFFYTVFFFKRILYALTLVFVSEVYIVPLNILIFFVTMVPMLFMTFTVPFRMITFNALLCLNEGSEVIVAIILLHYNDQWLSDEEFFGYAQFAVIYITIWILINVVLFLIHLIWALLMLCLKMFTFRTFAFKEVDRESTEESSAESVDSGLGGPPPKDPPDDEPPPPAVETPPEVSSEEEDFVIEAANVRVDDKTDNLTETKVEKKVNELKPDEV